MADPIIDLIRSRRLARSGEARRIREAAGLSLTDLAPEILVHASTLARWERGIARPRKDAALRWEAALRRLRHEVARPGRAS